MMMYNGRRYGVRINLSHFHWRSFFDGRGVGGRCGGRKLITIETEIGFRFRL